MKTREELSETKNIEDVMPYDCWKVPNSLANLVTKYAWDTPLQKPFLFSGMDYTLEKILFLVENAGPLNEFDFLVRKLITNNLANNAGKSDLIDKSFILDGMQGTLIQLLISRLDITLKNKDDSEIEKGMAESFIDIVKELLPNQLKEVKAQAQKALFIETNQEKSERESSNIAALHQVFDAIKQNDGSVTEDGIREFKAFVKNIKMKRMNDANCLTDNGYYLDLLHLISSAFEVLAHRGGELTLQDKDDRGGWYGKKADLFCFEIIGLTLQDELPPRVRQEFMSGIYYLFNIKQHKANRFIDPEGLVFRGEGTETILGESAYYDDLGREIAGRGLRDRHTIYFKDYYEKLYEQLQTYHQKNTTKLQLGN